MTIDIRSGPPDASLPELEPGVTLLETPEPRSPALHQLALDTIRQVDGGVYWEDARNTSSTYALNELAPHRRLLRRIRLARAFTAYQHFSLARRLVNRVSARSGCLIAPNLASLYRDDDVPDHEAHSMLEAVLTGFAEVADVYNITVLVTDAGRNDDLATTVADHAATKYRCEQTPEGFRFTGEDFETTVYWQDGYWQTTIPYWVDLLGVADEQAESAGVGPVTPTILGGA